MLSGRLYIQKSFLHFSQFPVNGHTTFYQCSNELVCDFTTVYAVLAELKILNIDIT